MAESLFTPPGEHPRRVTVADLADAKTRGKTWPMLTCYDATTADIFDTAGIPALLVGDSAANIIYGYPTTLPISVEDLLGLTAAVARATRRALVVADLPFGSYQRDPGQAVDTAVRFVKEGGAHAVKLEGGRAAAPAIAAISAAGIPVIGHLGLTPQSVHALGGYRVQGRTPAAEHTLGGDADAVADAGAVAVVIEAVPTRVGQALTERLSVPTIGIGAGPHTDAQILVWADLAGLTADPAPRFVKRYANLRATLTEAVTAFGTDVVNRTYPGAEHSYR